MQLTDTDERLLDALYSTGAFESRESAVAAALRMLARDVLSDRHDNLTVAQIKDLIAPALADIAAGRVTNYSSENPGQLVAETRARYNASHKT